LATLGDDREDASLFMQKVSVPSAAFQRYLNVTWEFADRWQHGLVIWDQVL